MADGRDRRAFIVGCGRSGTTLLESILGAHREIKGFPESWFFVGVVGQFESRTRDASEVSFSRKVGRIATATRTKLGIANKSGVNHYLTDFLTMIGRQELFDTFPLRSSSIATQVDAFVALLDKLTEEDGKNFWIEKTPHHLYYIDAIEGYVRPAKFIHIVRSGPDVVASYFDAGNKHGIWKYYDGSLDRCINAWNHSIPPTILNMRRPGHIAVSYEQLVEDPEHVVRKLCSFLEADFDPGMLTKYSDVAQFVSAGEPWKATIGSAIRNANNTKFDSLFTKQQQDYVRERLIKVDLSQFYIR